MSDKSDLFRSTEEQAEPIDADVKGTIPSWLKGCLLRLGPGKFELGQSNDFVMNHWFDGYAILYKFEIRDGKVKFSKKFLQSDAYKRAVCVGRPVFTEFGTRSYPDPCKNIFSRMMSSLLPEITDNNIIGLYTLEDSLFVASETSFLHKVNPEDLKIYEKADLFKLIGLNVASSHILKDDQGFSYCLGSSVMSGIKHHIVKIPKSPTGKVNDAWKKAKIFATINSPYKLSYNYYHSFGMSENYFIFIEQPMVINMMKMLALQTKSKTMKDCMEWHPSEMNKFIVVDKTTGKMLPVTYKSSAPFFVFHHINSYEQDGHLVLDLNVYNSPEIMEKMYLEKLRSSESSCSDLGVGRRYVLPLPKYGESMNDAPSDVNLVTLKGTQATAIMTEGTVTLTGEELSESGYDLPTMNKTFLGKKYKYFYAVGLLNPGPFQNSIVKINAQTGETQVWKDGPYSYPGEVQFVSRKNGTKNHGMSDNEDDGLLLSCVTDIRKGEPDYLLILDAKDLTEIARAEVMVHVPPAIHGIFL